MPVTAFHFGMKFKQPMKFVINDLSFHTIEGKDVKVGERGRGGNPGHDIFCALLGMHPELDRNYCWKQKPP